MKVTYKDIEYPFGTTRIWYMDEYIFTKSPTFEAYKEWVLNAGINMNRLEQQIEVLKGMLQKTESHTEAKALAYGINAL